MPNKNFIIIAVIIVIAALALWGVSKIAKAPENMNDNTNSQANAQNNDQNNLEVNNNAQANANGDQAMNGCTRNFNPDVLKEKTAPTETFATFTVKDFGTFKVQLYPKDAPKTVENFTRLVKAGYYNCLTFHRVAHDFVIQTGDPTGTGSGGDSAFGGAFADELNVNTPSYKAGYVKGILAMANAGQDTNTSQFFINVTDNTAKLGHNYTIFGKVVSGQDVVDKIGKVPVTPGTFGSEDGKPVTPVVIESAVLSAK